MSFGLVTATAECALVSIGLYGRHHDVQPERMHREIYKARHQNISQNSEITQALPDLSSTCLQTILLSSSLCFLSLQRDTHSCRLFCEQLFQLKQPGYCFLVKITCTKATKINEYFSAMPMDA